VNRGGGCMPRIGQLPFHAENAEKQRERRGRPRRVSGRATVLTGGEMENYYDPALGDWVTDWWRYEAIACQPRFRELEAVGSSPGARWALLLELLAAVPEDVVHLVGSGPLESFIATHGAAFVDELEAATLENERLRWAVLEVDLPAGLLPETVESRLVAAFGPRFELLPAIEPARG
jgi:hypothetical protein